MPRSASSSVSVPKRAPFSFELDDALLRGGAPSSPGPREYDSWPCDSFFLLPDAVLAMDAGAFRADLKALDPVLSASLPDWPVSEDDGARWGRDASPNPAPSDEERSASPPAGQGGSSPRCSAKATRGASSLRGCEAKDRENNNYNSHNNNNNNININGKRPFTLLHNHKGLLVRSSGKGTVLIGGGGDANEGSSSTLGGGVSSSSGGGINALSTPGSSSTPTSNGPTKQQQLQQQQQQQQHNLQTKASTTTPSKDPSQKDHSSGLCYKDREERVRQLRERQQQERQQKLEELKEQAAAAQRFREQQEAVRRQRLDEMRSKDSERRSQVEERKKLIQQADQERREAVLRKSAEREQRLELKRRQERSNAVFAFGSSTPRMLDPKENIQNYFGARRATSTTNVNLSDSSSALRRSSESQEIELSRKRATSAHSLNRKPDDLRMSTSMYEVFNWDDGDSPPSKAPLQPHSSQGEDPTARPLVAPPPTAARRRTDLLPTFPSLRDSTTSSSRGSPRHRSPGFRSGTTTPGSPSRPTSALSQTSAGSQILLRNKTSPKKPRPLSIAGSTLSSADKPRESAGPPPHPPPSTASPASPNRESRSIDRKLSTGSVTSKPLRAKSVGSDRSAPSTPAKTPRGTTPKRTPAQVKAESAAKKASERSKATPKLRSTPKTTPLQSPSVENKSLPGTEKKTAPKPTPSKDVKPKDADAEVTVTADKGNAENVPVAAPEEPKVESVPEPEPQPEIETKLETEVTDAAPKLEEIKVEEKVEETVNNTETEDKSSVENKEMPTEVKSEESQKPVEVKPENQDEKTQAQRAAEKPVTGYASEVEYKAALAEKRRQAREAKERELELERQRELEEAERERREEEEYLKLMEDQKKVEEERLRKAILEAERLREEETIKKEEEEKQRIEAEKIEHQKKLEAEEKMRKEEEERQMRKSRVAAIMSRTRGRGPASTPSKAESKTPCDEVKNLNDSIMSCSMTENIINNISSSMSDSMIVEAIESHKTKKISVMSQESETETVVVTESLTQAPSTASSQPPSDISQPLSDLSSQPLSDVSNEAEDTVESNSQQFVTETQLETQTVSGQVTTTTTVTESNVVVEEAKLEQNVQDLISGVASINLLETHVNGNAPTPMDTTPTPQTMDLLGSFNGVNGIGHNGMDSGSFKSSDRPDNEFGSLDPLSTITTQTILPTSEMKSDTTTFDQIIDLNQTKLTNEDAVNSNPPPPIIAFEDNLNKKSQNQETSSNVPDLLL